MRELANVNYQKELEKLIEQHEKEGKVPRLFLHACCAPCSSYVLEYLSRFFSVTVFFYNPNISPKEEYVPEGGERCFKCYRLRMEAAAKLAQEGGYDYFTTTLSISPLKNAGKINEIGQELAQIYKVEHLPSDFKKKNGYKRSIELSHEYGLYRQNYCGCVFSKRESMEREKKKQQSCMDCQ